MNDRQPRTADDSPKSRAEYWSRMVSWILLVSCLIPYLLLFWLSLGSGWTYPRLAPDQLDGRPWRVFFQERASLWNSVWVSSGLGLTVASVSTVLGMWLGRHVQAQRGIWMFLAYLPFACSPVVIGICLLDLFIRCGLASTVLGVFLIQTLFATAFATILFSELGSREIERLEHTVVTLGGSTWQAWRHAAWPKLWKLTLVCWLQTLLVSWLDYALVSTIGGGLVPSVAMQVMAYIREASVNQAAQAALVLIIPPVLSMGCVAWLLKTRQSAA